MLLTASGERQPYGDTTDHYASIEASFSFLVTSMRPNEDNSNIHRVYIPVKSDHSLVVLNFHDKKFWYFNSDPEIVDIGEAKAKCKT